jgi:hypothetical protein
MQHGNIAIDEGVSLRLGSTNGLLLRATTAL